MKTTERRTGGGGRDCAAETKADRIGAQGTKRPRDKSAGLSTLA